MGGVFGKNFGETDTVTYNSETGKTETETKENKPSGFNPLLIAGVLFGGLAIFIGYKLYRIKKPGKPQ